METLSTLLVFVRAIYQLPVLSPCTLQWRHNGRDGVSNYQPYDCLLNRLFGYRAKKTSKLYVTGLCAGNSPRIGEFPAQMASNAESVSIWWRHHGIDTGQTVELPMAHVTSLYCGEVNLWFVCALGGPMILKHVCAGLVCCNLTRHLNFAPNPNIETTVKGFTF